MAEFRALGPIEAVVAGRPVNLGAPKQRALLALLVSRVGQPVAIDVIVEELWTGRPPPSAITSLQAYVANLRKVLEPDRAPRTPTTVLRTCGRSYLLDDRVVEVDVHRFDECATAGWQALGRGDPRQALHEFEAGLALWRGQAYTEVADATCVVPGVVRLEELRLSVIEGRCAALLGVGAHEVAAAELEAFTQAHPLREYAYELLSLALYRAGRQADALAALRSNQKRLAEELGIDPRPALQRLEREILNQAPTLDWRPPVISSVPRLRYALFRMREIAFVRTAAGFSVLVMLRQATWLSGRTRRAPWSVISRMTAQLPSTSAYSAPFPMRAAEIRIENFSATCAAASHHGAPAGPVSSAKLVVAPVRSWVDRQWPSRWIQACGSRCPGRVVGRYRSRSGARAGGGLPSPMIAPCS